MYTLLSPDLSTQVIFRRDYVLNLASASSLYEPFLPLFISEFTFIAGKMAMGAVTTSGDTPPGGQYANDTEKVHDDVGHVSEDDSPHDENKAPPMVITDSDFNHITLKGLSKLRKSRTFCDVILQVRMRGSNMAIILVSSCCLMIHTRAW